jgi:SAM-dependent methyltransferase
VGERLVQQAYGCGAVEEALRGCADLGRIDLPPSVRRHLDECRACWAQFVALRWTLSEGSQAVEELQEYLGQQFEWGIDASWRLAEDWNARPRGASEDVEQFYRTTRWYLYTLVLWDASGQRRQYVEDAREILSAYGVRSVLDLGAGVGTDSLRFAASGIETHACEFDNAASRFLLWRAARRHLAIRIHRPGDDDVERLQVDLLWAMDVIEHLPDPERVLSPLLKNVRLFIYDTEHAGRSGGRQPFHYEHTFEAIAAIASGAGLSPARRWSASARLRVFERV